MTEIRNLADKMVCEGCTECSRSDVCPELKQITREVRKEQIGKTCSLSLCEYYGVGNPGYIAVFHNRDCAEDPICVAFRMPEADNSWRDAAFAKALTEVEDQLDIRKEGVEASYCEIVDARRSFCKK